jgi:hypothetical protein
MSAMYSEMVKDQINGVMEDVDRTILAGRGIRQLTSNETKYYQALIEASKSTNAKQAISNIDVAFPETIIDTVLDDIEVEHPLLSAIDFRNTSLLTSWIYNTEGTQKAVWGALGLAKGSNGVNELEGEIAEISLTACKLYAYMTVTQDMLDAGPAWVDRYVRAVLTDALALGMEDAVVNGNGLDQPVGMIADGTVDSNTKAYKEQTPVAVTEFSPKTMGDLVESISYTPSGRPRKVNGLIMVVNPGDYYKKVMPATTILAPDGTYRNDVFPVPCTIIQSTAVASDRAVFGIGANYFMGMGLPKNGKLEYDDSQMFLEDLRAYKIKFIGNGRPLDFNSFKYLDISNLKELVYKVEQAATA